jgi:DNA-directed RNA polymerase II subunit RPB1
MCGTCGLDVRSCPGHCGHIELPVPCWHVTFIELSMRVLRSVCYFCSRTLITRAEAEALARDHPRGKLLFAAVYALARTRKRCQHCNAPQPQYFRSCGFGVRIEWPESDAWASPEERAEVCGRVFTSIEAASILDHIPDEDCELMGLDSARSHPRNTVLDVVLCPPPISRPAIMQSTGSRVRGQDDLTHTLQAILKRSIELRTHIGAAKWERYMQPTPEIVERMGRLQAEVFSLVNNSVRGQRQSTQRSGAPIKSVTCRLKGKEGRIRGNLMGKRVDFSARSVITPDSIQVCDSSHPPLSLPYPPHHHNPSSARPRGLCTEDFAAPVFFFPRTSTRSVCRTPSRWSSRFPCA